MPTNTSINHHLKNKRSILFARQSPLPSSVDWRTKGVVNEIKDQGGCGSCWAFSATGSLESAAAIAGAALPNLSEQNLVDCAQPNYDGCSGGWMGWAFDYIKSNGDIDTQSSYPYISGNTGTVIIEYILILIIIVINVFFFNIIQVVRQLSI